jgi:hypothetical protein
MELEQNIGQRYHALLRAQRETLEAQSKGEIDKLRDQFKADSEEVIGTLRAQLVKRLSNVRDMVERPKRTGDIIEDAIAGTPQIAEEREGDLQTQQEKITGRE